MIDRVRRLFGRIGVRLLVVNLVVLLVPAAGLEFARIYETQLLGALERDMRDQAALVRATLEARAKTEAATSLDQLGPTSEPGLERAAATTRTRVRVLDEEGNVLADSHRLGPPEGPEPEAPTVLFPQPFERAASDLARGSDGPKWPVLADRDEVKGALAGVRSTRTRFRGRAPEVILFLAEPVRIDGRVRGVVYVTRSTQPVLLELYKIRSGLFRVLAVAIVGTAAITILLALSISRPLSKLAGAARRIAVGELSVEVPVRGTGEVRELSVAFATMKEKLIERLKFSSDFAADVAHELKSPLTGIRGAAELLREGAWEDPADRERFLSNIELDVARMDALVSRLLLLGRIEASSLPMSPVDIGALVDKVASRVRAEARGEGRSIEITVPVEPVIVKGRAGDLETAIANLLDNALRYTRDESPVEVVITQAKTAVSIAVKDRGPGVDPADHERIWSRFFTKDAFRGGTGLGLAIVKSVVAAHGGSVALRSEPGDGAAFILTLPRA